MAEYELTFIDERPELNVVVEENTLTVAIEGIQGPAGPAGGGISDGPRWFYMDAFGDYPYQVPSRTGDFVLDPFGNVGRLIDDSPYDYEIIGDLSPAGVPEDGTSGQILTKVSANPFDTKWSDPQVIVSATEPTNPVLNQVWVKPNA